MATYTELFALRSDSDLRNRVAAACAVAAEAIRAEDGAIPNHANRLAWAADVFQRPEAEAERMLWALLAANKDTAVDQIRNASDSQIQDKVDVAVDLFATGS